MNAPGRNDPCWCGSAKKYKKCHRDSDEAGTSSPPATGSFGLAPRSSRNQHLLVNEAGRDGMRKAGRFNAALMDYIRPFVLPGVRGSELDQLIHDWTVSHGGVPACLGYKGFPASSCISANEVVCHGIPDDRALRDGDIVNLDLTSIVDGWHGDQSETFLVGEVEPRSRELVQVAFDCLWLGIDAIHPFGRVIDIGRAIQNHAHAHGFSVVRDYQGHGIGRVFHQDPGVPHYPDAAMGAFVIEPGMCFTIEPMINAGTWKTTLDRSDGWTVRTGDNHLSAQFEHTLLMTDEGVEVLTATVDGPQPGHAF